MFALPNVIIIGIQTEIQYSSSIFVKPNVKKKKKI